MVWSVGDVAGLEHDVTEMPDVPAPESLPRTPSELVAAIGIEPNFKFWDNFDQRPPTGSTTGRTVRPPRPSSAEWYRFVPASTFDDPVARRVPVADPARHARLAGVVRLHTRSPYIAPSIDLSVAFHRSRPDEPWLYAQASAPSASGGLIACESRVWARDGTLLAVGASQLLCRPTPGRDAVLSVLGPLTHTPDGLVG